MFFYPQEEKSAVFFILFMSCKLAPIHTRYCWTFKILRLFFLTLLNLWLLIILEKWWRITWRSRGFKTSKQDDKHLHDSAVLNIVWTSTAVTVSPITQVKSIINISTAATWRTHTHTCSELRGEASLQGAWTHTDELEGKNKVKGNTLFKADKKKGHFPKNNFSMPYKSPPDLTGTC